ncbi:MAG: DMT family transporter [Gemmatimonadota bacterium]
MLQNRPHIAGTLLALAAGTLWGTTGPLSTALYAEGAELTSVGFWRVLVAAVALVVFVVVRRPRPRMPLRGLLIVGLGGGAMVALFEVAYQYAIAGAGVAGAAALLYTAPFLVTLLAVPLLGERITALRLALAVAVGVGAGMTVAGGSGADTVAGSMPTQASGIIGGLLAALAYAGTTLLARYAVPRYGAAAVLTAEIGGAAVLLAILLPLAGRSVAPPATAGGWVYVVLLALGAIIAANFFFFGAVRRIDAAPAAVAATIEPVVGAILALVLFSQALNPTGWLGLAVVVSSVALLYLREREPAGAAVLDEAGPL